MNHFSSFSGRTDIKSQIQAECSGGPRGYTERKGYDSSKKKRIAKKLIGKAVKKG